MRNERRSRTRESIKRLYVATHRPNKNAQRSSSRLEQEVLR